MKLAMLAQQPDTRHNNNNATHSAPDDDVIVCRLSRDFRSANCSGRLLFVLLMAAVVMVQCTQIVGASTLPLTSDSVLYDSGDGDTRREQQIETIIDRLLENAQEQTEEEQPSSSDYLPLDQVEGRRKVQYTGQSPVRSVSWNRPWMTRMASKRGPGICINSCLTGGMTFVRCKSMCH